MFLNFLNLFVLACYVIAGVFAIRRRFKYARSFVSAAFLLGAITFALQMFL